MQTNDPVRLSLARPGPPKAEATPLFRTAAMQAAREPLHGRVTVVTPPSASLASAVALTALILLGAAAFIVEVPQRARAVGVLMPAAGFMKIVAADAGQVVEINIAEGERVTAGQALIRVSSDRGVIDRGPVSASQLRSLHSERRLQDDANRERQLMQRERLRSVGEQLANVDSRLDLVNREMDIQRAQKRLLASRFERLLELSAKGNVPAVQLDDEKLVLLKAEADFAVLQQQAAHIVADRHELWRIRTSLAQEAEVLQIEFAIAREQLKRQIAALEALVSRSLQAPEDGVVARVTVRAGQSVRAGQTLMTLHQGDPGLEAWLYLPSANAGLLHAGQQVELRLEAWPHQMFGTQPATVASISHIALLPSELDVPLAITGPVFEVRAKLHNQHISAHGKEWPLAAGTSFQADIVQGRYRLYEWLLRMRQNGSQSEPADA